MTTFREICRTEEVFSEAIKRGIICQPCEFCWSRRKWYLSSLCKNGFYYLEMNINYTRSVLNYHEIMGRPTHVQRDCLKIS